MFYRFNGKVRASRLDPWEPESVKPRKEVDNANQADCESNNGRSGSSTSADVRRRGFQAQLTRVVQGEDRPAGGPLFDLGTQGGKT